jgi:16S rRNA (guanine1207-N2)-methyltransferase
MAHYSDETERKEFSILVRWKGESLPFLSSKGVFSKDGLDTGTAVLLESMQLPASGTVLDLGCGIGVVGILTKRMRPDLAVTQSDVTEKAVSLTRENARAHGVASRVVRSDCYEAFLGERFNTILLNPPRAAGKDVIRRMIADAPQHLVPGGSLQLVAMTNKGGKSYEAMLSLAFGNVEKIGRGSGFSVYRSVLT